MEEEQAEQSGISDIEPGKAQPNYSGFLTLRINEIWGLWSKGHNEEALTLALRLAKTFVPEKFKKPLEKDVEIISKELEKAKSLGSPGNYESMVAAHSEASQVGAYYLPSFLSKLSSALDTWGYYEHPRRRMAHGKFEG